MTRQIGVTGGYSQALQLTVDELILGLQELRRQGFGYAPGMLALI